MNTSMLIEPEIIVNTDTREIHVPSELYNIGVMSDNNAETVKIIVPRYFDNVDLSTKKCEINIDNALKERGVYEVNDIEIFEDTLLLSWKISSFVTRESGQVIFSITFTDDDGYSLSTLGANLNVLRGIGNNVAIKEDDYSLYRSLLYTIQNTDLRINELIQIIGELETRITELENNV